MFGKVLFLSIEILPCTKYKIISGTTDMMVGETLNSFYGFFRLVCNPLIPSLFPETDLATDTAS
jgi:hypothetical protein